MKEFIICFTNNRWYSLEVSSEEFKENHSISSRNKYYTFQVSDLIRDLKARKIKKPPQIIDLESFDKQFSQQGKELLDFKNWHILKSLRKMEIIDFRYRVDNLEDFLFKIKKLIFKLKDSASNELKRFKEIEIKISEIIYKTALDGIKIDRNILDEKCISLHRDIYSLKNEFQFYHNIFQPENYETQGKYLITANYRVIVSIEKTISLLRKSDELCGKFYKLNRLSKDLKTLLLLKSRLGGVDYVNPYFVGFGSITSRIIIKEPSLQNLKKENRNIIIPSKGKELFYIDYSQFEASILAHCSADKVLLKLINEQDVYSDIASKIYNTEINNDSRKKAKILFYRYLYGDTFENKKELKTKVESYFRKFETLNKFKENLIRKAQENRIVNTRNGNFRKLDLNNDNTWILSHFIQSKASYIFKNAIIETFQNIKNARLLIPLHDGALYEIDIENSEKTKTQIRDIYTGVLQKECNLLINPQAKEEKFHIS
tara:strand:- start:245 stop:1705 length:1461 start_codon:yes stop_codon:yes gene_type:complete